MNNPETIIPGSILQQMADSDNGGSLFSPVLTTSPATPRNTNFETRSRTSSQAQLAEDVHSPGASRFAPLTSSNGNMENVSQSYNRNNSVITLANFKPSSQATIVPRDFLASSLNDREIVPASPAPSHNIPRKAPNYSLHSPSNEAISSSSRGLAVDTIGVSSSQRKLDGMPISISLSNLSSEKDSCADTSLKGKEKTVSASSHELTPTPESAPTLSDPFGNSSGVRSPSYRNLQSPTGARILVRARSRTEIPSSPSFSTKLGVTQTEKRLIELLMVNQCTLLEMICQGSFVGDIAASVSKGVVHLLRGQDPATADMFLKKIFRQRTMEYVAKGRDLNDIIRDNSMATMLLTAFARAEGTAYLQSVLSEPLKNIYASLDSCEVDPSKLKLKGVLEKQHQRISGSSTLSGAGGMKAELEKSLNHLDNSKRDSTSGRGSKAQGNHAGHTKALSSEKMDPIQVQLEQNRANLQNICDRLFSHIFDNCEEIPQGLRRIARLLHSTVEEMMVRGLPPDFRCISRSTSIMVTKGAGLGTSPQSTSDSPLKQSLSRKAIDMGITSSNVDANLDPASQQSSVTPQIMKALAAATNSNDNSEHIATSTSSGIRPSPSSQSNLSSSGGGRGVLRMLSFKRNKNQRASTTNMQGLTEGQGTDSTTHSYIDNYTEEESITHIPKQEEKSQRSPFLGHLNTISDVSSKVTDDTGSALPSPNPTIDHSYHSYGDSTAESTYSTTTSEKSSGGWLKRQRAQKGKEKHVEGRKSPHEKYENPSQTQSVNAVPSNNKKAAVASSQTATTIMSPTTPSSARPASESQFSFRSSVTSSFGKGIAEPTLKTPIVDHSSQPFSETISLPLIETSTPFTLPHLSFDDNLSGIISKDSTAETVLDMKKSNLQENRCQSTTGLALPRPTHERAVSENAIEVASAVQKSCTDLPTKALSIPNLLPSAPSTTGLGRIAGILTVAEKVVGSFLFLRFVVPAITSPDTNSIQIEKLNGAKRRGLVLCGKLLTALCNDIEFGSKEDYLMDFNEYLRAYRHQMKDFLQYAITTSPSPIHETISSPLTPSFSFETGSSQTNLNTLHRDATIVKKSSNMSSDDELRKTGSTNGLQKKNILSLSLPSLMDDGPSSSTHNVSTSAGTKGEIPSKPGFSSGRTRNPTDMPVLSPLKSGRITGIDSVEALPDRAGGKASEPRPIISPKKRGSHDSNADMLASTVQTMTLNRLGKKDKTTENSEATKQPILPSITRPSHLRDEISRSSTASIPSTTVPTGDPDLTALFQCLLKSIDRIEKDVEDGVGYLAPEAGRHLVFNYQEFRALLESGPYSTDMAQNLPRNDSATTSSQASMLANSRKKAYWLNRVLKGTFQMFSRNNSSSQL